MEIDGCLWEVLYAFKALYDHGKHHALLEKYRNQEMDGDDYYDFAVASIFHVFADTREYYNSSKELDAYVFFDPVITEFYQLCAHYEKERGVSAEGNPFRKDMFECLRSGFCFNNYDYDYVVYDKSEQSGGCRLVLLLGCEFCCHYEVVAGLLDVYEAYQNQLQRLKEELGMIPKNVSLEAMSELKEAA